MNYVEANICNNDINEENWHKRGYHTHSDVIFGWVAWICMSISDFFAEYLDFVFTMGGKIEKSHGGAPPGPRGSAPAPMVASPSGPAVHPHVIFQFYHPSWKQSQDTQQKSPRYSAKPTLSAKNNVAMHMIARFMPKHNGKHFIL